MTIPFAQMLGGVGLVLLGVAVFALAYDRSRPHRGSGARIVATVLGALAVVAGALLIGLGT